MYIYTRIWFGNIIKLMTRSETMKVAIFMVMLCIASLMVMSTLEGWTPWTAFYWFCVTITTVGYGDRCPSTVHSQAWAILTMFSGIGGGALLLGNIATTFVGLRRKKMKGLGDYSDWKDHIVVMGWHDYRTLRIIDQASTNKRKADRKILLCSEILNERPEGLPEDIQLVIGPLSSDDVIHRTGIREAAKIIIDGKDDKENALATLAVAAADDDYKAHITVMITDPDNVKHIHNIASFHGEISIVKSLSADLIAKEMQDRGVAGVLADLVDNHSAATPFRVDLITPMNWVIVRDALAKVDIVALACIDTEDTKVVAPTHNPFVKSIFVVCGIRIDGRYIEELMKKRWI